MQASVTLTAINQRPDGSVEFKFGKQGIEFASLEAAKSYARGNLSREALVSLIIGICLERQPTLSNPAVLEGRTLSLDTAIANLLRIT